MLTLSTIKLFFVVANRQVSFKIGPTQVSFSFMFVFSNTHYNFYNK